MIILRQAESKTSTINEISKKNTDNKSSSNESSSITSSNSETSGTKHNQKNSNHRFYSSNKKIDLLKYKMSLLNNQESDQINTQQEPRHSNILNQAKSLINFFSRNKEADSSTADHNLKTKHNEKNEIKLKSKCIANLILKQQQQNFNLNTNNHRVPFIATYLSNEFNKNNFDQNKLTNNFKPIQVFIF
jgi:hypothetical protein